MYGIIYKATNLLNEKIYIGKTTRKLEVRMKRHFQDAVYENKTYFQRALDKYGVENFNWCIIDIAFNSEELNDKEKFWIDYYNTYVKSENSNGYNMTIGGDGASGEYHPQFGQEVPDDVKQKIKESLTGKYTGEDSPLSIPVLKLSLNGKLLKRYPGISEALRDMNLLTGGHISDSCKEKVVTAHGFIWIYEQDFSKEYVKERVKRYKDSKIAHNRKSVIKLDFNGNFVEEYPSIAIAAEMCSGNGPNITKCCYGEILSVYEHIWIFKEDYNEENVKERLSNFKNRGWGKKPVIKLTVNLEYVKEYPTLVDAANSVSGRSDGVWKCCNGKLQTYKGFKWKYKE